MLSPFEQAWSLLKADFADVGPLPALGFYGDPITETEYVDEDEYMTDIQAMLELEALRQASESEGTGGREVPLYLLQGSPSYGRYDVTNPYRVGHAPKYSLESVPIANLPKGRRESNPLGTIEYPYHNPYGEDEKTRRENRWAYIQQGLENRRV